MHTESTIDRRHVLKGVSTAALAGLGFSATAGRTAAEESSECCHECWLDIKPGSCPNSINPDSNGVVPALVGWPHLDPETVRLVPREEDWGNCSNRTIPEQRAPSCGKATDIWDSDPGTAPIKARKVDSDGDGDPDWQFKFETEALDLEDSVNSAILVSEGTGETADCTVWGVDSVNIVGQNDRGPDDEPNRGRDDDERNQGRGN